jgi:uncharacterized protein
MTVARPVGAFLTALCAGITENLMAGRRSENFSAARATACCNATDDCLESIDLAPKTFPEKLRAGVMFALDDLMADLAGWLLLGFLIAGIITALVPESLVSDMLGSGFTSYLVTLVVGLPMYVCASASTPIAAALIAKGMSPGAALVFLMAGPATNAATMTMVAGLLGKRTLAVYIGSIVLCTLGMAYSIDSLYQGLGWAVKTTTHETSGELLPQWVEIVAAGLLAVLMLRVAVKKLRGRQTSTSPAEIVPACGCATGETGGT